MSWISSVGQTQRKDRFLPSQSFLSSEVGDKSEVSQPVLYHFRWWCSDEKSVARLRVWFLLFPMWPRWSREKSHELLRLPDTCVCFPWPPVCLVLSEQNGTERDWNVVLFVPVFVWTGGMLVAVSSLWHTAWLWERSWWWQSVHGMTYVHLDESRSQESSSHPVPLKVRLPLTHFYWPHLPLQRFHLSQNSAISWGTFQTQTYRQQWWKVQWRKSVVGWM